MRAEYHGSMYKSGRLPPKKYRALPWGLSTTVACTRMADYHPNNIAHYESSEAAQDERIPYYTYSFSKGRRNTQANAVSSQSKSSCFACCMLNGLGGANPAVNTPRPSRGTRIESCDFIVLIGDPWFFLFVSFCLASRVEWERRALSISFVWHVACDVWLSGDLFFWGFYFIFQTIACVLTFLGPFIFFLICVPFLGS